LVIAIISSPAVLIMRVVHVPKVYSLLAGDYHELKTCFSSCLCFFLTITSWLMYIWQSDIFMFAFLVRLVLGCAILMTLRLFRVEVFSCHFCFIRYCQFEFNFDVHTVFTFSIVCPWKWIRTKSVNVR
jgi:hypothetical protein